MMSFMNSPLLVLRHVDVDISWPSSRHVSFYSPTVFRCGESPRYRILIGHGWKLRLIGDQKYRPFQPLKIYKLKIHKYIYIKPWKYYLNITDIYRLTSFLYLINFSIKKLTSQNGWSFVVFFFTQLWLYISMILHL